MNGGSPMSSALCHDGRWKAPIERAARSGKELLG